MAHQFRSYFGIGLALISSIAVAQSVNGIATQTFEIRGLIYRDTIVINAEIRQGRPFGSIRISRTISSVNGDHVSPSRASFKYPVGVLTVIGNEARVAGFTDKGGGYGYWEGRIVDNGPTGDLLNNQIVGPGEGFEVSAGLTPSQLRAGMLSTETSVRMYPLSSTLVEPNHCKFSQPDDSPAVLSWQDRSRNETGFEWEHWVKGLGGYVLFQKGIALPDVTSVVLDYGVLNGEHAFHVRGFDAGNYSR